jgi:murein DD-endopeptidase MepM/ murein hydrolase activator NlpD
MRKEPTKWVEQTITGQVDENIYKDLLDQGYNENFVANLVAELGDEIFAWRIDFFSEQRVGDRFSVLLEREYILNEKEPLNNIRVVAALYEGTGTRNKKNYAFKFTPSGSQPAEFFDDKGKAARGLFLRAPFSHKSFRISSHFSRSRFHPIHRVWRPHHGTDYAAPVGTPVVAIGSGKIVRAGWHGGYGRCIDIRHNKKYMSRYGHMSKINVHVGENVAQGQYIGKSGATGVATGPHLHFEMHVYGKQRNFLRLKFPSTKAVAKKDLRRFETVVGQYIGKLNSAINMTNENLLMVAAHKTDEAD